MEDVTSMISDSLLLLDNNTDMTSMPIVGTDNASFVGNHTITPGEDNNSRLSTTALVVYFTLRVIFSGFAIFGNILTIVAVIRFERLRNTTNFLIASLAAADMLAGMLTPLDIVHHALSDQPAFIPVCLLDKTMSITSVGINLFSIMWIAIDRYIYIAHPLHYHTWVTRTKTFILIALTWLLPIIEVALVFMLTHHLEMGMSCKFSVFLNDLGYSKILMPQFGVYAGITVVCYVAIGRIAHKQGKVIAALNQPYDTYEAAVNRQQKRIAKMMGTVLGTYITCYIPQIIATVIFKKYRTIFWLRIEMVTNIIYWANTWLNPIIYTWKSEDFRVAFRKLLGRKPTSVVPSQ